MKTVRWLLASLVLITGVSGCAMCQNCFDYTSDACGGLCEQASVCRDGCGTSRAGSRFAAGRGVSYMGTELPLTAPAGEPISAALPDNVVEPPIIRRETLRAVPPPPPIDD